jgi:hypothetical protein
MSTSCSDLIGRARRAFLAAAIVSLVAIAAGPAGVAMAEGPAPTINSPASASATNNPAVPFRVTPGEITVPENLGEIGPFITGEMISIAVRNGEGTLVQTVAAETPEIYPGNPWEAVSQHLADGTYTAVATQTNLSFETAVGAPIAGSPVTFTVDTTSPSVTLTSPANGSATTNTSQTVAGRAGTAAGDLPRVTVQVFPGSSAGPQPPLEALVVSVSEGGWSAPLGLAPGTYTALAQQSDEVGNLGVSAPVTFTVLAPPPVPPPAASFTWFPAAPKTGENVSLVSSSTDMASPITGFAWSLAGTGVFQTGKSLLTTSFTTPGSHVVRLRVSAANGSTSIATETIPVSSVPLVLMQPFPIVRIAGSETLSGVNLRLLTAQAPAGARITVSCQGRGCPAKTVSQVAVASKKKGGTPVIEFRRFERALKAGVILEIRISKAGEIGKFTRFTVRRNKLPERGDACLGPTGVKPIVCPPS